MIKNPSKKANAKALVMHFDLIQKHNRTHQELQFADDYMKDRGKTFHTKNPDVKTDLEDKDAAKVVSENNLFWCLIHNGINAQNVAFTLSS